MGYTHYWKSARGIDAGKKEAFLDAVRKVLAHPSCPKVSLEYDEPDEAPQVDDACVRFNGIGDEGCETFSLDLARPIGFEFTKTRQRPYDVAVTAVLTLAHHVDPDWLEIISDGGAVEWAEGVWLAQQVVPEAKNPLKDSAQDENEDPGNGPAKACPRCASSVVTRQPHLDREALLGYTCNDCGHDFWVRGD